MSAEWLRNMGGGSLTDEEMQKVPYPTVELTTHVIIKSMQFYGIIGTWIVGPLAAVGKKETRNTACLRMKMAKCGRVGVLLGVPGGILATYLTIRKDEEYKVWDRCYRLRHNRGQVRVDQACTVTTLGGAAIGAATGGGVWFGGLMGMTAGLLGAAIYNGKLAAKQKAEAEEAKKNS
ncbi:uncharacterized protein LOC128238694 [Mya arenaria]|uniref:uncharacterized protein LOC128238694 n=1 Tax=Mya arenaria TaxID=6604 RepID=UPI0022E1D362|nr:uncharacterized protein LOC128238694 [Mya arenaria]